MKAFSRHTPNVGACLQATNDVENPANAETPPREVACKQAPTFRSALRAFTSLSAWLAWPLIALVKIYQHTLSPVLPILGVGCRFYPTCSHYSVEALRTHGALRGFWLTLVRLAKCTPLHPGGVDLVPPRRPRGTLRCTAVPARAPAPRTTHHTLSLHG